MSLKVNRLFENKGVNGTLKQQIRHLPAGGGASTFFVRFYVKCCCVYQMKGKRNVYTVIKLLTNFQIIFFIEIIMVFEFKIYFLYSYHMFFDTYRASLHSDKQPSSVVSSSIVQCCFCISKTHLRTLQNHAIL